MRELVHAAVVNTSEDPDFQGGGQDEAVIPQDCKGAITALFTFLENTIMPIRSIRPSSHHPLLLLYLFAHHYRIIYHYSPLSSPYTSHSPPPLQTTTHPSATLAPSDTSSNISCAHSAHRCCWLVRLGNCHDLLRMRSGISGLCVCSVCSIDLCARDRGLTAMAGPCVERGGAGDAWVGAHGAVGG